MDLELSTKQMSMFKETEQARRPLQLSHLSIANKAYVHRQHGVCPQNARQLSMSGEWSPYGPWPAGLLK